MPDKIKMTQPETPDVPQGRDMFQTPNYATELLIPFIPKRITDVWECSAGFLKITNVLKFHGYKVLSSDIVTDIDGITWGNFLDNKFRRTDFNNGHSAIITNPPYSLKKKFYEQCKNYKIPFALLIPCDYCGWLIDAIRHDRCEKLIPSKRIDFITPTGKSALTGQSANYHSMWLTWGFELGRSETFVELTKEMKQNI